MIKHHHPDKLEPSKPDHVMMCQALEVKFLELSRTYQSQLGVALLPPASFRSDLLRWRRMFLRYKQGDFRHKESEWRSVKAIGQWLIDKHMEICGQPARSLEEYTKRAKDDYESPPAAG